MVRIAEGCMEHVVGSWGEVVEVDRGQSMETLCGVLDFICNFMGSH